MNTVRTATPAAAQKNTAIIAMASPPFCRAALIDTPHGASAASGNFALRVAHVSPQYAVRAPGLATLEAARPEGAAGFGPVFIHAAYGLACAQLQVNAAPAGKLHIGLPTLGKEALGRQATRGVIGQQGKVRGCRLKQQAPQDTQSNDGSAMNFAR